MFKLYKEITPDDAMIDLFQRWISHLDKEIDVEKNTISYNVSQELLQNWDNFTIYEMTNNLVLYPAWSHMNLDKRAEESSRYLGLTAVPRAPIAIMNNESLLIGFYSKDYENSFLVDLIISALKQVIPEASIEKNGNDILLNEKKIFGQARNPVIVRDHESDVRCNLNTEFAVLTLYFDESEFSKVLENSEISKVHGKYQGIGGIRNEYPEFDKQEFYSILEKEYNDLLSEKLGDIDLVYSDVHYPKLTEIKQNENRVELFETDDVVEDHRRNNTLSSEEYKALLLKRQELRNSL